MPVDAAYRRISEREFGFALGAYDTNHSRVIDLARLSRAACSRAFGGVLREIAGDVAESEGGHSFREKQVSDTSFENETRGRAPEAGSVP